MPPPPRLMKRMVDSGGLPLGEAVWQQERLLLPVKAPLVWRHSLTDEVVNAEPAKAGRCALRLREIFASFPVALLENV